MSLLTSVGKLLEDSDGARCSSSREIQGTPEVRSSWTTRGCSTLRNIWGLRNPLPSSMHWGKSRTSNSVVHQLCDLRRHLPSLGFSFPNIEVQVVTSPFSGKEFIPTQTSCGAVYAGNISYLPALESGDSD